MGGLKVLVLTDLTGFRL